MELTIKDTNIIPSPEEMIRMSREFQDRVKPYSDLITMLRERYSKPYILIQSGKVEFLRKSPDEVEAYILELEYKILNIKEEIFPTYLNKA